MNAYQPLGTIRVDEDARTAHFESHDGVAGDVLAFLHQAVPDVDITVGNGRGKIDTWWHGDGQAPAQPDMSRVGPSTRWSLKVPFVNVWIKPSALILPTLITLSSLGVDGGVMAVSKAAAYFLIIFNSIYAHEMGHIGAGYANGARTTKVEFGGLGGVASISGVDQLSVGKQQTIAAAGPLVSLALGLTGMAFGGVPFTGTGYLDIFTTVNLGMAMVNLIPFGAKDDTSYNGLDGRRLWRKNWRFAPFALIGTGALLSQAHLDPGSIFSTIQRLAFGMGGLVLLADANMFSKNEKKTIWDYAKLGLGIVASGMSAVAPAGGVVDPMTMKVNPAVKGTSARAKELSAVVSAQGQPVSIVGDMPVARIEEAAQAAVVAPATVQNLARVELLDQRRVVDNSRQIELAAAALAAVSQGEVVYNTTPPISFASVNGPLSFDQGQQIFTNFAQVKPNAQFNVTADRWNPVLVEVFPVTDFGPQMNFNGQPLTSLQMNFNGQQPRIWVAQNALNLDISRAVMQEANAIFGDVPVRFDAPPALFNQIDPAQLGQNSLVTPLNVGMPFTMPFARQQTDPEKKNSSETTPVTPALPAAQSGQSTGPHVVGGNLLGFGSLVGGNTTTNLSAGNSPIRNVETVALPLHPTTLMQKMGPQITGTGGGRPEAAVSAQTQAVAPAIGAQIGNNGSTANTGKNSLGFSGYNGSLKKNLVGGQRSIVTSEDSKSASDESSNSTDQGNKAVPVSVPVVPVSGNTGVNGLLDNSNHNAFGLPAAASHQAHVGFSAQIAVLDAPIDITYNVATQAGRGPPADTSKFSSTFNAAVPAFGALSVLGHAPSVVSADVSSIVPTTFVIILGIILLLNAAKHLSLGSLVVTRSSATGVIASEPLGERSNLLRDKKIASSSLAALGTSRNDTGAVSVATTPVFSGIYSAGALSLLGAASPEAVSMHSSYLVPALILTGLAILAGVKLGPSLWSFVKWAFFPNYYKEYVQVYNNEAGEKVHEVALA
ncbi:MAG: hypothetical protein WCG34_11585, partial [Leptolinea sp.]